MRLHELVPRTGVHIVHNDEGDHTLVLTSCGALFHDEDTDDMTHMCVAFGQIITGTQWRLASAAEIAQLRNVDALADLLMHLHWTDQDEAPPVAKVCHLRLVQ